MRTPLVSSVFVVLGATLTPAMLASLDLRAVPFVLAVMPVVRPASVWLALAGTDPTWRERGLIAWVGPRGVVAVAVSGLFGAELARAGVAGGEMLAPLAFALVAATVVVHGFSVSPLARALGLSDAGPRGVLIAGAAPWTVALAETLREAKVPVLIADDRWSRLRLAREAGVPVFHGELLSEAAEHRIRIDRYGALLAASGNGAYDALVCTALAPELDRNAVFQTKRDEDPGRPGSEHALHATVSGRPFASGATFAEIAARHAAGWRFVRAELEDGDPESWRRDWPEAELVATQAASGELSFATPRRGPDARAPVAVIAFAPPEGDAEDAARADAGAA